MVGSTEHILNEGQKIDDGCRPYDQALAMGDKYPGIHYRPREVRKIEKAGKSLSEVNMRVAKIQVKYEVRGCVIDPSKEPDIRTEERFVRGDCPADLSERCGNCVMTLLERRESQQ